MKTVTCGFEADRLYKTYVQASFKTPSTPITITGYRFKLAMRPSDAPLIGSMQSADVLWLCRIDGIASGDDWGHITYKDPTAGTQNLHGDPSITGNYIAHSILKASPWTSAVNDVLEMSGLDIHVPAGSNVVLYADHGGKGPIDFECQGGFFYK